MKLLVCLSRSSLSPSAGRMSEVSFLKMGKYRCLLCYGVTAAMTQNLLDNQKVGLNASYTYIKNLLI